MLKNTVSKLGLLLAFMLTLGNIWTVTAYAAPDTGVASASIKTLTGLRITDLDKPVAGRTLDSTAKIRTNENVTWDIPVTWVDEKGNAAVKAEPGKTYYPTFTFFFPAGYESAQVDSTGRVAIRLPQFLTDMYGTEGMLYAADTQTGLTYISFAGNVSQKRAESDFSKWLSSISSELAELTDEEWKLFAAELERAIQSEAETAAAASGQADAQEPAPSQGGEEAPVPAPRRDYVDLYCAPSAVNTYDRQFLEWFAGYIKDTVQPQAVNYIVDRFPQSFGSAVSSGEELSYHIGLYIYNVEGTIDGQPAVENALAYVQSDYADVTTRSQYSQIMAVNTESVLEQDEEGNWRIKESEKANLDNTIVHEMFHAFMNDYTRYGMYMTTGESGTMASGEAFPIWFVEGSASAVENVYQYRTYMFAQMATAGEGGTLSYTEASIKDGYINSESAAADNRLNLSYCDSQYNTASAYVAGYLATLYLANLQAEKDGNNVIEFDGTGYDINIDNLRSGLDKILLRLHGDAEHDPEKMDTIVADISTYVPEGYEDPISRYENTAAFAESFISGDDEEAAGASLYFTSYYLAWLNAQSYTDEGVTVAANGSIMNQAQNYKTPLTDDISTDSSIYLIPELDGMIVSSVDDDRAMATGGTTLVGPEGWENQGALDPAAKAGNEGDESPAEEPVAAEVGNEKPADAKEAGSAEGTVEATVAAEASAAPTEEPAVAETSAEPAEVAAISEAPAEPAETPAVAEAAATPAPEPVAVEIPTTPAVEIPAASEPEPAASDTP